MGTSDQRSIAYAGGAADTWETVRRAFAEFLTLPTGTIIGFLLLAAGTFVLDRSEVASLEPARAFLKTQIFTDAKAPAIC
ncbi:MAG: hypothetical protein H0X01_10410 [Nitrospira sp.]|nr:hypothetical protein [Nitrospira sp.]